MTRRNAFAWIGLLTLVPTFAAGAEDALLGAVQLQRQAVAASMPAAGREQRVREMDEFLGSEAARNAAGVVSSEAGAMEDPGRYGIAKPLMEKGRAAGQVYVWPVPAGAGVAAIQGHEFTYVVQYQHAAPEKAGAVVYVAYADSDGDGKPDTLIARSEVAQTKVAGGWTGWSFSTSEHLVFVGLVLLDTQTPAFVKAGEAGPLKDQWMAPEKACYVAAAAGETPRPMEPGKLAVANLQVRIER